MNSSRHIGIAVLIAFVSGLVWIAIFGTWEIPVSQDPTSCEDSLSVINNSLDINKTARIPSTCLNSQGDLIVENLSQKSSGDRLKKTEEGLLLTK